MKNTNQVIKENKNVSYVYVVQHNRIDRVELHVGDFVKDKDGNIGYISHICHCEKCKERGFYEVKITYLNETQDDISSYSVKTIHKGYQQIGTYKFECDVENTEIAVLNKYIHMDFVSMYHLYQQIKWERDVAVEQLHSYGIKFGEKVDVKKVEHGKWNAEKGFYGLEGYRCSECGKDVGIRNEYVYCPYCGAKNDYEEK